MNRAWLLLLTVVPLLTGCRGTHIRALTTQTFPKHEDKVCVLASALPPEIPHVELAAIKVELNSYGGDRRAKAGLAKAARSLGAHAVVKTSFGNMLGAPEGDGIAVALTTPGTQLPQECEWY